MLELLIVGHHLGGRHSTRAPSSVAQSLFETAFHDGWSKLDGVNVGTLDVPLDPYFPRSNLFEGPKNGRRGARTINLPIIRELSLGLTSSVSLWRWLRKRKKPVVVTCFHYVPVSLPMLLVCCITMTPIIVVFTDLPLFTYSAERVRRMPAWKRPLMGLYSYTAEKIATLYSGYILFSAPMGELVNPRARPAIVMEGIFNSDQVPIPETVSDNRRCGTLAYAGTLDREYGIQVLLDTFALVDNPDARLWLFGSGDMDEEILARAAEDERITHYGFLPREDVLQRLQEASMLVNLRDPKAKFTKYSFPSKLLEYLATGTPVASTRLEGIPAEYFEYAIEIEFGEPRAMASRLKEVLELDTAFLADLGRVAREFVFTQKTAIPQVARVARWTEEVVLNAQDEGPRDGR